MFCRRDWVFWEDEGVLWPWCLAQWWAEYSLWGQFFSDSGQPFKFSLSQSWLNRSIAINLLRHVISTRLYLRKSLRLRGTSGHPTSLLPTMNSSSDSLSSDLPLHPKHWYNSLSVQCEADCLTAYSYLSSLYLDKFLSRRFPDCLNLKFDVTHFLNID